jgi:hypothetical protein
VKDEGYRLIPSAIKELSEMHLVRLGKQKFLASLPEREFTFSKRKQVQLM